VLDLSQAFAPLYGINGSLLTADFIKAPTDVIGSVGGVGLLRYELQIARVDSEEFTVIGSGGSGAIANGKLGTIDPSLLQNDAYNLRLVVYGTNGDIRYVEETVNIAGELKLGNFRLSFTDLAIPVTGIPITVSRTYDTLTSKDSDDLGYGWRLEFRDTDLRTSLRKRTEEEEILGIYPAFNDRTKVFITLPGGTRQAFSFKAEQVTEVDGQSLGYASRFFFKPTFVGDKGVTSTLTLEDGSFFTRSAQNGEYVNFQIRPFHPSNGVGQGVYVLKTKDGTKYRIDAETGDLLTVEDTNGNKLTYSDDGIVSSTGQKVTFERDGSGRIKSVKTRWVSCCGMTMMGVGI
jgi:hypothetical protein